MYSQTSEKEFENQIALSPTVFEKHEFTSFRKNLGFLTKIFVLREK